jgi:hypothetical protein
MLLIVVLVGQIPVLVGLVLPPPWHANSSSAHSITQDCLQHCLALLTLSMSFFAALSCWSSTSSDGQTRSETAARLGAGRERRWGAGA